MSQAFDDVRYSELLFLQSFGGDIQSLHFRDSGFADTLRLSRPLYADLVITLLEDLCIKFENASDQMLVARLRQEAFSHVGPRVSGPPQWNDVRQELETFLLNGRSHHVLRITYRGLRRIEELREILRHERILEPMGILLDMRYFERDFQYALQRPTDIPVSVLCADMDGFKNINDKYGHDAGDVVMRGYLLAVKQAVGAKGDSYRGLGDEVKVLLTGSEHAQAGRIAEEIRRHVGEMRLEHSGQILPFVTASIGLATTPPEDRVREIERLADQRQRAAKDEGKNRVISH